MRLRADGELADPGAEHGVPPSSVKPDRVARALSAAAGATHPDFTT